MSSAFLTYEEVSKYITEITTGLKVIKVRATDLSGSEYIKTIMLRQPTSEEKRIAQLKHDEAEEEAVRRDGLRPLGSYPLPESGSGIQPVGNPGNHCSHLHLDHLLP